VIQFPVTASLAGVYDYRELRAAAFDELAEFNETEAEGTGKTIGFQIVRLACHRAPGFYC